MMGGGRVGQCSRYYKRLPAFKEAYSAFYNTQNISKVCVGRQNMVNREPSQQKTPFLCHRHSEFRTMCYLLGRSASERVEEFSKKHGILKIYRAEGSTQLQVAPGSTHPRGGLHSRLSQPVERARSKGLVRCYPQAGCMAFKRKDVLRTTTVLLQYCLRREWFSSETARLLLA